ncbi:unnamed protein product [Pleuronectes platessa]|uniref:Uncharacterized protein n=1 Tax=Pleuronectes platessa TaxID=8262 RepID=A0A9N7YT01_PLEPL|nr:unnamed protein product [Pleuronectes platessa]
MKCLRLCQPRRTTGGAPPHERRVPPAGAVAEMIREMCPTRIQSRHGCRRTRSPRTARLPHWRRTPPRGPRERKPPHQRRREAQRTRTYPPKNLEACHTPSLRWRGEEGNCSPSKLSLLPIRRYQ